MTDITELAQSLKSAAEKATPGPWEVQFGEEIYATDSVDNEQVAIATLDARDTDYIALANPANILALLEALEKAQQRIAELDIKNCELDSLTQRWAVERAENADRIAELESRTVKLPELCVGVVQGGHAAMVPYPAGHWFNKTAILEMLAAAGIKVEAE
ncbi:ead/Ea22-like family protein [Klebsiella pneumoniae]